MQTHNTYFIVDALDECDEEQDKLLELILGSPSSSNAKWLVTSRKDLVWPASGFNGLVNDSLSAPQCSGVVSRRVEFQLEEKQNEILKSIGAYIDNAVGKLQSNRGLNEDVAARIKNHLIENSEGTFLWVSLVCQVLVDPKVLKGDLESKLKALPKGLDAFYSEMWKVIQDSEHERICKEILAIASIVARPVKLGELRTLATELPKNYDFEDITKLVVRCGSFLAIRDQVISFVHKSAKDYLVQEKTDFIAPSGWAARNYDIFLRSLEQLSLTLRRDICDLNFFGPFNERKTKPNLEPLDSIGYSTVFWVDHFESSAFQESFVLAQREEAANSISKFLREKFLYWLEALSLLNRLSNVLVPVQKMAQFMVSL